ncbi:MAG: hypothetical protein IPK19_13680 [Chloroflexi bacterium]|nr:hypothetical protein [Chloroflexota bacterium]
MTPTHRDPTWIIALLIAAALAALLLLPREAGGLMLWGLAALSAVVLGRRWIRRGAEALVQAWKRRAARSAGPGPLPELRPIHAIELAIAAILTLAALAPLYDFRPNRLMGGNELSYLINSGAVAGMVFRENGALPLWNPLIGTGEPLFENPFSFALNPLMLFPIVWQGAVHGPKVAVMVHAVLMVWGGWFFGLYGGMRPPGRMLLALLLTGAGSFTAAIGEGFFQVGLSQAYVPWVFAGLLALVHPQAGRRHIALLAVPAMLLIFAGTYFYVLPTAIACAVVVDAHLFRRGPDRRFRADAGLLRRAGIAVLLVAGLAAARLLPQIVHAAYVQHPLERFLGSRVEVTTLLSLFFFPDLRGQADYEFFYHFVVWLPLLIAVLVAGPALIFAPTDGAAAGRGRIVVPALLLIALFVVWAQAHAGAPMRALYNAIPLLNHWRFTPRMLAAAAPWVAFLVAVGFDQALTALWRSLRAAWSRGIDPSFAQIVRGGALGVAAALLILIGVLAAQESLRNWGRRLRIDWPLPHNAAALTLMRQAQPQGWISYTSRSFHDDWAVYDLRVRAAFGNPDYRPRPVTPTIGTTDILKRVRPPVAVDIFAGDFMRAQGYKPLAELNGRLGYVVAWTVPKGLPHVFLIPEAAIQDSPEKIAPERIAPVEAFAHDFDTITIHADPLVQEEILVVQETAYPGWTVTVDGEARPLESVGGFIGVRLPASADSAEVVFAYQPVWFYAGCAVTVATCAGVALWLLRGRPYSLSGRSAGPVSASAASSDSGRVA